MPEIIDNIGVDLKSKLQEVLVSYDRMDTAVGYFNLRGWSAFDALITDKANTTDPANYPVARILIGMVTTGPQEDTMRALDEQITGLPAVERADTDDALARKAELLAQLRAQLQRGRPNPADRRTLQSLRDLLARKAIEIRVFTSRALHGKTYIFHRTDPTNPITGFVGSSNLTGPGLSLHGNLELNVDILDRAPAAALAQWFTDRWEDHFSLPVDAELLDLLDDSWASPIPRRPYEVYLKVCYDLSRDVREGLTEYSIPPAVADQLLDFQATAVRTLARRLMTRRGTMLGDVVGLGKTITAIAVALMLRAEHGFDPLVVCPPNLASMWRGYLDAYELPVRVVPYSQAHKILPELRAYRLVIVDESHTMRNAYRRDYMALHDYIRASDSRVLELTATPYNTQFLDVANQLGLYIDDDDDLGIAPVHALAADPRLVDKVDGKITTLRAFERSENADDWKRLMSEHLVRRTRTFIKRNYAHLDADGRSYLQFADGSRFIFPTRTAIPIDHSFGADDPAALMADDTTLNTIRGLHLPRYDLSAYLDTTASRTATEREFADNLARGRGHVAGFVRTLFYKRLSSCGYSFIISLRRHLARNDLFLYAIDNDLPIPAGTITENTFGEDDDPTTTDDTTTSTSSSAADRYESLVDLDPPGLTWLRPTIFTPALRHDIADDTTHLRQLLDRYGPWTPARDSKLTKLIDLLTVTHPDDKVLIFTEYKDTALYIATALRSAGLTHLGVATGDSADPTELARRFAPRSNTLPGHEQDPPPADELRILIATDVLSEGQNLQDAHIIVNYDLPWAIIRLIQRAGRIDRVGQLSPTALIYSFFHESVDNVIALRQRIAARLAANAEAFGSDEKFLGGADETKSLHDLYNGHLDEDDDSDDVDASSLAFQVWQQAETTDPDLATKIANLPDLLSAVRARRLTDETDYTGDADGVICYVRTTSGVDGFGRAYSNGTTPRLLTGHEALRAFEALPTEPGLPVPDDHDELVKTLVQDVLASPSIAVAGRLRGVRRTVWNRLSNNRSNFDADTNAALDALYNHPLTRDADIRLRRTIRNQISDTDLTALVTALYLDDALVLGRSDHDPIHIVCSMGVQQQ